MDVIFVFVIFLQSYNYIWMQGPQNTSGHRNPMCIRTLTNFSEAVSPAFVIDGKCGIFRRRAIGPPDFWFLYSVP